MCRHHVHHAHVCAALLALAEREREVFGVVVRRVDERTWVVAGSPPARLLVAVDALVRLAGLRWVATKEPPPGR